MTQDIRKVGAGEPFELAEKAADPLAQEVIALRQRADERRDQATRLRGIADGLEDAARSEDETAAVLERDGDLNSADLVRASRPLGGRRLVEAALEVYWRDAGVGGEAIHYRDWYRMLRHAGHRVGGKVPENTLLAAFNRAEEIEREGRRRSGFYRPNAPEQGKA